MHFSRAFAYHQEMGNLPARFALRDALHDPAFRQDHEYVLCGQPRYDLDKTR